MTRDAINTKGCSDKIMYKGKAKDSPKQTINAINQAIAVCEPIQFLAPAVLRRTETFWNLKTSLNNSEFQVYVLQLEDYNYKGNKTATVFMFD